MQKNPKLIIPRLSNGTEFMLWYDGQCDGCSRYGKEQCRCPLEAALIMGDGIKKSLAIKMGFDEEGNPPVKLKCYRKYKKHTKTYTGELFNA